MWLVNALCCKQGFENVVEPADTNERIKWEDCVLVQGKWSLKMAAPLCGLPVSILARYNTRKHNYTGKSWQVWQHRLRFQQLLESIVKYSRFEQSHCLSVCLNNAILLRSLNSRMKDREVPSNHLSLWECSPVLIVLPPCCGYYFCVMLRPKRGFLPKLGSMCLDIIHPGMNSWQWHLCFVVLRWFPVIII